MVTAFEEQKTRGRFFLGQPVHASECKTHIIITNKILQVNVRALSLLTIQYNLFKVAHNQKEKKEENY